MIFEKCPARVLSMKPTPQQIDEILTDCIDAICDRCYYIPNYTVKGYRDSIFISKMDTEKAAKLLTDGGWPVAVQTYDANLSKIVCVWE